MRKYALSHTELLQKAFTFAFQVERDLKLFREYGFDETDLEKFVDLIRRVEILPSDSVLRADLVEKGRRLKLSRKKMYVLLRNVRLRFELAAAKSFDVGFSWVGMYDLNDKQLIVFVEALVKIIRLNILKLNTFGIDEDFLAGLTQALDSYKNVVSDYESAKTTRKKTTERRNELLNAIYADIIVFAKIGRSIHKNSPHFSDYLVYER